jgi:hypothetical protein
MCSLYRNEYRNLKKKKKKKIPGVAHPLLSFSRCTTEDRKEGDKVCSQADLPVHVSFFSKIKQQC